MALEVPYRSIPDMFFQRVAATPDKPAFGYPGPDGPTGASGTGTSGEPSAPTDPSEPDPAWLTWAEAGSRASAIAAGLRQLGIGNEDRVAIAANTRLEWVLTDLGVMCAGGATTAVYPNTEAADAIHIVGDSGSRVLVAEDPTQVAKLAGASLPELAHVVLMDGEPDPDASPAQLTLAELERRGAEALAADPDLVERAVATVEPDHVATLIYTSGTTGLPKGVELLHRGWCWQGVAQVELDIMRADDLQFLWLPLSHSFGKTLLCGIIHVGMSTYVDGRMDRISDNLRRIRPTLMCASPRIYEKVYNRVVTTALDAGGAKAKIFTWAVGVGRQHVRRTQAGEPAGGWLGLRYRLADRLVFHKIRARLGGRIRVLVSGAAPLPRDIAEFFAAAGLPILEGYGLTEASAGDFVNRPGGLKIGTVGQPLGDLECRIAEDGEVLLRGAPVMRGYHNLPEETAAALDDDGCLTITDRKKDLVKTSGGKYIAPSLIEGMFKAICPYTSHAVVVAQARSFCTMLVTLDPDTITGWAAGGPLEGRSYQEIVTSPEVEAMVDGYVKQLNAGLNRWETIKRFTILPRDLTIEDGEVTPSMKVRRAGVESNFAETIDAMYAGTVAAV